MKLVIAGKPVVILVGRVKNSNIKKLLPQKLFKNQFTMTNNKSDQLIYFCCKNFSGKKIVYYNSKQKNKQEWKIN